jgi:hypothetical protein
VRHGLVMGYHLVRSFGWRVVSAVSMADSELAQLSASAVRCQSRHIWLWQMGVVANFGGISPSGEGVLFSCFGRGAPKCAKRKLCLALLVSAMSTPLGVDSIVEGVVVATWGSPSRSSVVESFVVVVLQ